ncbi:N-fatty-acyl-amino acid synthase/hydrolase PM20D1-like [Homarus americanus]|uniref:N-fatty-acyl-amino acid synthase/hydrolase PM20D1-like n=1 Tax=Homarus americanus TaxID=6706 RepID=UPI001C48C5DC|nr:N-fatty-acyl-amino acid synthase/hydrolase PM20D1-like [Homarus americanus]
MYDTHQLLRFHEFLRESFPHVFNCSYIETEVINTYSLLFTVTGSTPELQPYLLMGHMDVVPADPTQWTHDPWAGLILPDTVTGEDYIWGRGAIDNKIGVMGIIMALNYLAKTDFQPTRSFYVAFGHDEEVRGADGAGHISQVLQERGVTLDFLLDEGTPVISGLMPGFTVPTALISVTEKGYMTLQLQVEGEGGHSSMPPQDPAVSRLVAALNNLALNPQPSLFGKGPEGDTFTYLATKASWPYKLFYSNLWLFTPLLEMVMSRSRESNALLRTTTSITIVRAGVKENVVPSSASAIINHRVHPAQSVEDVIQHDLAAINDPTVKLTVKQQMAAYPVSPYGPDVPGWRLLTSAIHHHFPGAVVAPAVMMANTDSLHYLNLTSCIYRHYPIHLTKKDIPGIHGSDERLSVTNLRQATRIYHRVMVWAGDAAGPPQHHQE